jgi:hypothetical protein
MQNKNAKKAMLKNILKGKGEGKSPIKMDNGLGKTPLGSNTVADGGGSNLGTKKVF